MGDKNSLILEFSAIFKFEFLAEKSFRHQWIAFLELGRDKIPLLD
jgi:hypothetical protein